MSNYSRSGEYELVKVVITTNTANPIELDLQNAFVDILVYESIFDGTMSGNISFVDTNNLVRTYGLGQGETFTATWFTSGIDNSPITVEGVVYDCQGPMPLGDKVSGYTLHFASPEFIGSMKTKLFNGFTDSCSNIVKRILAGIGRTVVKRFNGTETRNIEHLVFAGQTPLQGIDMCAKRAVSSAGMSGYLFFENNQEFRFTPIEELYTQEPSIEYMYRSSATFIDVDNANEESFNVFQDYEIETPNKFIDDLHDGQYGSSHAFLSIMDKSMTVHSYNSKDKFDATKSLGKSAVSVDRNFNSNNTDRVSLHYRSQKSANESGFVDNKMKLLKSNSFTVNIGVFGNSGLKVGDVIKATIPSFSHDSLDPNGFDNISGKFLVAEIKHVLSGKRYNQRIKLIKDSFEETLA